MSAACTYCSINAHDMCTGRSCACAAGGHQDDRLAKTRAEVAAEPSVAPWTGKCEICDAAIEKPQSRRPPLTCSEACAAEKQRRYYEAHADEIAEKKRRYREAHADEIAEKKRRYREAHADEIAEKQRRYYEAHADEIAEKQRRYHEAHADEIAEKQRRYYEAHADEIAEKQRRYREAHADEIAEKQRRYREAHADEIAEKQRRYYEAHADEIAEKQRPKYSSKDAVWDDLGRRICPVCRAAPLIRRGQRGRYPKTCEACAPPRPAPRAGGRTHGLISTYNDGCHCNDCTEAAREYRARMRANAKARSAAA